MATQVGGAFVRIRPYVSDDDARALAALSDLAHDVAAAFDRFHAQLAEHPTPDTPSLTGGDPE